VDLDGLKARHGEVFRGNPKARYLTIAIVTAATALVIFGFWHLGFSFTRIIQGFGKLGEVMALMLPPTTGTWSRFMIYLWALFETIAIAFLGTLIAAILAFPFAFLAARNVVPVRVFQFMTRRFLDSIRGVDELIWALIFVGVVGLGPFAGTLAIIFAMFGTFGKLFSEAIEAVDGKPLEGVTSTGGSSIHRMRFGILPQVLPVIAGQALYFFESNTRSATIIGIVGAGGIGLHLAEMIRTLEYQHVAAIILMILVTVAIIDFISQRLRFAIIGESRAAV
jgi:phosphonate transport system permease protein